MPKSATTSYRPLPLLIVPVLVAFPVEVATPAPTSSVPLFCRVDEKSMSPLDDPMDPVDVTVLENVSTPAVEVTVAVPPMVAAPVTVKFSAAEESVPASSVMNVPFTVVLFVASVATPPVLIESRLLNVSPVMDCADPPDKRKVPVPALYVPLSAKSPLTESVPPPLLIVPVFVRLPVVVADPAPTSSVPLFCRMDEKSMSPLEDPMDPVDVTVPVNVRIPEVDVTLVVPSMVAVPAVKLNVTAERVPAVFVNVPVDVTLPVNVIVPEDLFTVRLNRFVVSDEPPKSWPEVPTTFTVPV